jgi:hypothetical protein
MNECRRGKGAKERLGAAYQKRGCIAIVKSCLNGQTRSLPTMLTRDTQPFVYSLQQRKGARFRATHQAKHVWPEYRRRVRTSHETPLWCKPTMLANSLLVCVMFACIARVMAARWKMRCRREHGRLASETATALLQSQPCEQFDTFRPDGVVRCKTSHQRRKHAMCSILLLGSDATRLPIFANRLRNALASGTWDACHRARQGRPANEDS